MWMECSKNCSRPYAWDGSKQMMTFTLATESIFMCVNTRIVSLMVMCMKTLKFGADSMGNKRTTSTFEHELLPYAGFNVIFTTIHRDVPCNENLFTRQSWLRPHDHAHGHHVPNEL